MRWFWVNGVLILALTACSNSHQENVEKYIQEIKARPTQPIDPLPEVKPYVVFSYTAKEIKDPFVPPAARASLDSTPNPRGPVPDESRPKEALENFSLDSLRMVGTLRKGANHFALIADSDAIIYRVGVGNYIGHDHGKIVKISEDAIFIKELISDGKSGWKERESTLNLNP